MQPKTRKLLTIKEWDSEDQPREKLLEKGVNSLSNSELLAIIVGSGVAGANAVALMQVFSNRPITNSIHFINKV